MEAVCCPHCGSDDLVRCSPEISWDRVTVTFTGEEPDSIDIEVHKNIETASSGDGEHYSCNKYGCAGYNARWHDYELFEFDRKGAAA